MKLESEPSSASRAIKISIIILIAFLSLWAFRTVDKYKTKLDYKEIEIVNQSESVKQFEAKFNKANEAINKELENNQVDAQKLQELEQAKQKLEQELQDAQKALQAKQKAKEDSTIAISKQAYADAPKPNTTSSCESWIRQAGITEVSSALWLVNHESSCNPNSKNPTSTAYGLGQFLNSTWAGVGCVKSSDPVYQLKCMDKYVKARYKSWAGAVSYWKSNRWY